MRTGRSKSLSLLLAEIAQGEDGVVVLLVLEQRAGRLGEQDLAAVAGVADACGAVDGDAVVLVGCDRSLARVDSHPDTGLLAVRPRVGGEGALAARRQRKRRASVS